MMYGATKNFWSWITCLDGSYHNLKNENMLRFHPDLRDLTLSITQTETKEDVSTNREEKQGFEQGNWFKWWIKI